MDKIFRFLLLNFITTIIPVSLQADFENCSIHDNNLYPQTTKYCIHGYLEDGVTGERLIGATVYDTVSRLGTVTNNYGFFSLTLPQSKVVVEFSYIGYQLHTMASDLTGDTTISIQLVPGIGLNEVEVVARTWNNKLRSSGISMDRMSINTISQIPAVLGEVDVMKALEFLPGVQLGSEMSTGINVRGGSPEQNLILLDGVPVYNVNHAFGLFSVFNPDAIKSVTLIKGGFPARYGGRLSSVVDIRMREGNMQALHGSLTLGLISSKLTMEGPIIKNKTSFLISARRTYADYILKLFNDPEEGFPSFFFYDINAKINHIINDNNRLYFSIYTGNDRFKFDEEEDLGEYSSVGYDREDFNLKWGNITSLLRWNHVYNNKLFSNLTVLFSKYRMSISVNEYRKIRTAYNNSMIDYFSGIQDYAIKLDYDYYPWSSHDIKFGAEYAYHKFDPGELSRVMESYYATPLGERVYDPFGNASITGSNDPIYASEIRAYIEDDFSPLNRIKINTGVHLSGFFVDQTFYASFEPRFSMNYSIQGNLSLKAAYSRMQQYIHLMTYSNLGLPTDLWLPVTSKVKPQYSDQYTLGMVYQLNEMFQLNVEGYYKTLNRIYAYKEGADYLSVNNVWQDNIEIGRGWSYGAEMQLNKDLGKLTGWLSYTYSKTRRQFSHINNGDPFPYKYDRTHQINLVMQYQLSKSISINTAWVYASGAAYSLASLKYTSMFNIFNWNSPNYGEDYSDISYYESRNNHRMPDYHRLDISMMWVKHKKTTKTVIIGVYNVYNRFNPFMMYLDNDRIKMVALYSVIPSINFKLDF